MFHALTLETIHQTYYDSKLFAPRYVFCKAFHENLYGSKFQWIIVGMYDEDWWTKPVENCTQEEMHLAVQGVLTLELLQISSNQVMTVADMVRSQRNMFSSPLLQCCRKS